MNCMDLLIVTVEEEIYRGKARKVIAPSLAGEIGIMPGHTPLLAILRPGEIRVDCPDSDEVTCSECHTDFMVVFGGYMEVQPEGITILADAVERAADIDEGLARHALEQAKSMLNSSDKDEANRAHLKLELAIAQLRVVRRNVKQSYIKL